jgi:6-phosphogluconate dehydrogenase
MKQDFGVVGMAVMGQNLALNIASRGFSVAVFNRTGEKTKAFIQSKCAGKKLVGTYTLQEFAASLEQPRKIMLMVKAGEPVDDMIAQVVPFLSPGDILIDGGNSFFKDTERRLASLAAKGIRYIGTGVSGGEEGALNGPCIIPGGDEGAYRDVEHILTKAAAQVSDGPCCTYIGPKGAGHYVKMVHNGIEYGMMQLIGETYEIMRTALGMTAGEMSEVFGRWNAEDLGGYLMEITTEVLAKKDDDSGQALVDVILDKAGQKGTGKWTSQNALDIGVPIPTIDAAVSARVLSAFKDERVAADKRYRISRRPVKMEREKALANLRDALYGSIISDYAQGMTLLRWASQEYGYNLNQAEIARIWQGGCIIRSKLLTPIKAAFERKKDLVNILVDGKICKVVKKLRPGWKRTVVMAVKTGVACPAMCASLAYVEGYTNSRHPANLIQAQRDYFGAHTYQRTDKDGTFHTKWF